MDRRRNVLSARQQLPVGGPWPLAIGRCEVLPLVLICFLVFCFSLTVAPAAAQPAAETQSSAEALRIYEGAANAQNDKAYELAAEEWARFVSKFPRDPLAPKARYYEGVCYLQLANWDKAISAFTAVVRNYPKFELLEDAYLNLGWCQFSAAEEKNSPELYTAAAATFSQLLEKFPTGKHRDQALFFQGESLYTQGKKAEAAKAYQALVEEFPQSKLRCDALYAWGVALEEQSQYAEAGQAYDQFLADCASSELANEVRMRKGETLLQLGEVEQAAELFGEVAEIEGFAAADYALLRQAFSLLKLQQFQPAAERYVQLVQRFPDSAYAADAELSAGRTYYRAAVYEQAVVWLEAALKRNDDATRLEAAHWLCRVHLSQQQPDEAEKIARKYVEQAKDHAFYLDLVLDLADALYEQPAQRSAALEMYLKIADENPEHRLAPQALYNAAFAALDLKDFAQSQALAERFVETYPDDALAPDARFVAVEASLQRRDFDAAEGQLRQLIEKYPQRQDRQAWQVRLGLTLLLAGKHSEAIEHLSGLVDQLTSPDHIAEAHYLIGASHFALNDFEAAQQSLQASQQASTSWKQADEAALLMARCLQKADRLDEAVAAIQAMIAKYPQSAVLDQAYYRLGEAHYAAGQYNDAIQAYQRVGQTNGESSFVPFALYGVGWSYLKLGQFAEAAEPLAQLIGDYAMHELADDALLALGMARRQAGQNEQAVGDFNKFLQLEPAEPLRSDALFERGLAEVALKKLPEAIATFQSLLEKNPAYANLDKVRYELAWAYRTSGDQAKALDEFARLAKELPDSPLSAEAQFHVAEHRYEQQQYEQAAEAYAVARERATVSELKEKATYKLGWCHFQLKQFPQAREVFAEQAANFPDGPLRGDADFMQAETYFQEQKYDEALPAFVKAQTARPTSEKMEALLLLHAGQSASQLKQWAKAVDLLQSFAEQFPQSDVLAEAHYELGWAKQNLGQTDDAWTHYETAAESRNAVGARARFMMGELRFAQKQYEEAVREFQRAMYLYGGDEAPEEIKTWQAKAAFEAGRCGELLVEAASSAQGRAKAIADAKKFYSFVTQKHGDSQLAAEAQKRLEVLARL